MKSKSVAILTSMTLAVMLISSPSAFGQADPEGHSTIFFPGGGIIPPGGTITAETGVQVPGAVAIAGPVLYHVQDNNPEGVAFPGLQTVCQNQVLNLPPTIAGLGPEDSVHVLVDSAFAPITAGVVTNPVGVFFPGGTGVVQSVTYLLGPIGAANPVVSVKGTPITYLGTAGLATPITGAPAWANVFDPVAANIGTFGIPNTLDPVSSTSYVVSCGCVDANGDGLCTNAADNPGVVAESYQVREIIGGGSLEISAVPLIVAGAEANALWLLPLVGIAGAVIAIRKLQA